MSKSFIGSPSTKLDRRVRTSPITEKSQMNILSASDHLNICAKTLVHPAVPILEAILISEERAGGRDVRLLCLRPRISHEADEEFNIGMISILCRYLRMSFLKGCTGTAEFASLKGLEVRQNIVDESKVAIMCRAKKRKNDPV